MAFEYGEQKDAEGNITHAGTWGRKSPAMVEFIDKVVENFRAVKDDSIVNAGAIGGSTLTDIQNYTDNAIDVALETLDISPKNHADTHKTGGSDALVASDIGAAPSTHVGAALGTGVHPMPTATQIGALPANTTATDIGAATSIHANNHKTGGSDALTAADIGAAALNHTHSGMGIPPGLIAMWSGSSANIPSGWALCDGQNGTPDLRNRFVLGAGDAYAVGATGGEAAHTLTINEIPNHTHSYVVPTGTGSDGTGIANRAANLSYNYNGNTSGAGGGAAHNNMPPYYALCYIMKL